MEGEGVAIDVGVAAIEGTAHLPSCSRRRTRMGKGRGAGGDVGCGGWDGDGATAAEVRDSSVRNSK